MQIIEKRLSEIKEYENNPRINDEAVEKVAESIKEFGFKVPIIIDANNIIVAGHTRKLAATKLGLDVVPCIVADDLTDEQVRAFRLADNKTGEFSLWDFEKLAAELDLLSMDMTRFGFDEEAEGEEAEEQDETYTDKIQIPQYEMTMEEPPAIAEMVSTEKTDDLIREIEKSSVTKEEKEFLKKAATRHTVFNYRNIAEYYAHATPEMQELMEKSALVIIDYEDAIANGYVRIKDAFAEVREMDEESDEE